MSSNDESARSDPRNATVDEFRKRIYAAKDEERHRAAAMTIEEKLEALTRLQELAREFAEVEVKSER